MSKRTLDLIISDDNINGNVTEHGLDPIFVPKLTKFLDDKDLYRPPYCFLDLPDDMDPFDIFIRRVNNTKREFSRINESFIYQYSQSEFLHRTVTGEVRWQNDDDYGEFHLILEGNHRLIRQMGITKPVKVVIDFTDHPLVPTLLKDLGYEVTVKECIGPKYQPIV